MAPGDVYPGHAQTDQQYTDKMLAHQEIGLSNCAPAVGLPACLCLQLWAGRAASDLWQPDCVSDMRTPLIRWRHLAATPLKGLAEELNGALGSGSSPEWARDLVWD